MIIKLIGGVFQFHFSVLVLKKKSSVETLSLFSTLTVVVTFVVTVGDYVLHGVGQTPEPRY